MDSLLYATVNMLAFAAMLCVLDPQAPDLGQKSVTSQVCTHICLLLCSCYFCFILFLVGNAAGAAVQIIRLYNSWVEWLKMEQD